MAAEPQSHEPEKLTAEMTVQWHTCAHNRMYTEEDCSYFALVLIPRDEVWWLPFSEVKEKRSICTNIEKDLLVEYRGNLEPLKTFNNLKIT